MEAQGRKSEPQERYPRSKEAIPTFREAFREYILPSFVPKVPPLLKSGSIFTQGSCFAENIANALQRAGVQATWLKVDEVMNSPLANRTYLEYALTDKQLTSANHKTVISSDALTAIRELLPKVSAMVFTVGLAYCRFGLDHEYYIAGVKGVPDYVRLTTVDENRRHIKAIINMVRAVNPSIKIILTLSPIPMVRAPISGSAIVADCLSKSVLRTALGQIMDAQFPDVYYWPAFEGIRWLGAHLGPVYGVEGVDQRHVGQSYIQEIIDAFVEHFFVP
jgi:hypothetical protein